MYGVAIEVNNPRVIPKGGIKKGRVALKPFFFFFIFFFFFLLSLCVCVRANDNNLEILTNTAQGRSWLKGEVDYFLMRAVGNYATSVCRCVARCKRLLRLR